MNNESQSLADKETFLERPSQNIPKPRPWSHISFFLPVDLWQTFGNLKNGMKQNSKMCICIFILQKNSSHYHLSYLVISCHHMFRHVHTTYRKPRMASAALAAASAANLAASAACAFSAANRACSADRNCLRSSSSSSRMRLVQSFRKCHAVAFSTPPSVAANNLA